MVKVLVELSNVGFRYDEVPVVEGISLQVDAGEFVGVVGPNGAGKSTLIRLAVGLLRAQTGTIRIGGVDVYSRGRRELARFTALVPQGISLDFAFRVRDFVTLGRTPYLHRFSAISQRDREAVERALLRTDCTNLADRFLGQLSGGERQRVLFARALAQEANVLALDEPTANLDLRHAYELMDFARTTVDADHAVIAAFHDLPLAARVCTRIVVLDGGRIAATGSPRDVLTAQLLRDVFGVDSMISPSGEPFAMQVIGPTQC